LTCSVLAGGFFVSASGADPATGTPEYRDWVSRFTTKNFVGRSLDTTSPLKLRITAVEGEEPAREDAGRFLDSRQVEYGQTVTTDGYVKSFSHTSFGTKGGGSGTPLPAETLARLDELLAKLPDDGGRLPPPDRRLMLQTNSGDKMSVRVYDRAHAPAVVWEILRLSGCSIGSYVLDFKPASQIDARGYESGGYLRLTPDGKQLLFTGSNQPLQFWEPATHELLAEVRGLGTTSISFSPDGSQAVTEQSGYLRIIDTKTWKFTRKDLPAYLPQFLPDGRHVIAFVRGREYRAIDPTTWEFVDLPSEIPPGAARYIPARGNNRAVVQLKSGAVVLWDVAARRAVATLRERAQLLDAAFSPDESQVVTQTDNPGSGPLVTSFDLWQTATGAHVHELRPFERRGMERSQGLLWTPDGQYILAGVIPNWGTPQTVCTFSAATGKHVAKFKGSARINGIVLLPGASQLVVGCDDGKISFWDFPAAMKSVREFEGSLASSSPP
jgi:WD40 repeat protein